MTGRARELRNASSPAERSLWRTLSKVRPRFTRQLVVGPYIADFACRSRRLIVELDGRTHDSKVDHDARRTTYLEASGWRVVRFGNQEALENPEGVAFACLKAAEDGGTHPRPLPEEGGE